METLIENKLSFSEQVKADAISKLDARESELLALADSAKSLVIKGPEDREGFKKAREKRLELKKARVSIENDAFELREGFNKVSKAIIGREKQLVAIVSPEESRLEAEEDKYNQWQEEIRIQKEREENERIQKRVDELAKFNHAHDLYELKIMPEENFQALLGEAEAAWQKEQERIAAEKAAEEVRRAEAEKAQRLYEERIKAEREELERKKAEYEAQRKADLELAEKAKKEREYIEEQQRKKAAELRAEAEKLAEEKRKHEEAVRLEQAKKEAAEKARKEEQEKIKREAEEKAERERLEKLEAERKEALKPDKEKLEAFGRLILKIGGPQDIKDHMAQEVLHEAMNNLVRVGEFLIDKSQKL